MTSPIADSVMAATHKLVQQAMQGDWHDVPRTLEQRRALLSQLSATASPQDRQWLDALQQAVVESDAAVAKIAAVDAPQMPATRDVALTPRVANTAASVDATLDMIRGGR